ncbi:hypothetical protein GCM10009835_22240 [Planosporangium flavigriseum]|uniref:FAD-binding PCMH-type domain-containing protein n=1 Tax=Planosporangium flavigriseum TaxID=373681 RepID=A0A8J3LUF2_9ACTN|nr:hypothetical protein Pfl04_22100 [Planosporangium flavigriseum]
MRTSAADGLRVKAVGSGHSFTATAATSGVRVELGALAGLVSIDPTARLVTVQAGMTLRRLNAVLAAHGLALPNLGDIDTQPVAGALATGTHDTGAGFGCLSTFVEDMEIVTGTGEMIRCSSPDLLRAAAVNIGTLGIVTELTLPLVRGLLHPAPFTSSQACPTRSTSVRSRRWAEVRRPAAPGKTALPGGVPLRFRLPPVRGLPRRPRRARPRPDLRERVPGPDFRLTYPQHGG